MRKINNLVPPALALYLLSPIVGELLSGSAPPAEFFTPFGFTIMVLLYGGGAVTVRELKVRWRKGMGSLLLLGAAYGVLEEGLMVASFQNPHWQDIGILGVFGRWLGINWVWAVELTAYHAIVSITVPIMLVELAYPKRKNEPWLRGTWLKIVPLLLITDVVIGLFIFAMFTGFWPPIPQYIFLVCVTLILIFLAFRLPSEFARKGTHSMRKPRYYIFSTTLIAIICGAIFWILPNSLEFSFAPLLVVFLGLLVILGFISHLMSFNWIEASPLHTFAITVGVLVPFILFSFLQEFDKTRTDNTTGMAIVGLSFMFFLILLGRRLKKNLVEKELIPELHV
jgi:hypothetical protein